MHDYWKIELTIKLAQWIQRKEILHSIHSLFHRSINYWMYQNSSSSLSILENKLFSNIRWRKDCMNCFYSSGNFFSEPDSKLFPSSCWHSSNCTLMGSRLRSVLSCTLVDRGILFADIHPEVHCAWCTRMELWRRCSSTDRRCNAMRKNDEFLAIFLLLWLTCGGQQGSQGVGQQIGSQSSG